MQTTDVTEALSALASEWREAKKVEDDARKQRVQIESRIIDLIGCKEEGSQTVDAGDWKIKVTGKINRTLDQAAWEAIAPSIPEALRPVTYKPALDMKGLRYLKDNEPDTYRRIAEAIVAKPGKPAVEVK